MSLRDGILWSLAAVLLLAVGSPSLHACDGGTAVPDPGNNPGLVSDCNVLLVLRHELTGTGYLNWDTRLAMTRWEGISISGSPSRVTRLALTRDYELTGSISAELGQLTQLMELYLGGNQLTGSIPAELGQLDQLQRLSLIRNQLTGEIPTELGQLDQLQALFLSHNQLTGAIPEELGQLGQLEQLELSDNQLTGSIPEELGQLTQLKMWLALDHNQLTGSIPAGLGQLDQLYRLGLNDNQLTGAIPAELIQLSALLELNLQYNQLTGEIPKELGQMFQLRGLDLSSNQLTGAIPGELGQLYQLMALDLSHNQLTGSIPAELGRLGQPHPLGLFSSTLYALHLQHNQLTGAIPTELGQLSQLREFSFRGNRLTGPVPTPLRHLPDVYVLNLAASWVGPGRMKVTWDDPGDPLASYEYQIRDTTRTWTDWAEIEDPETTLRSGEGVMIEWTLTGLPTDIDIVFIGVRASNRNGLSPEAIATVRPLEGTTLYFPDYVDGGEWSVQLALSHIAAADEDAAVLVTAYDREGQPIPGFFDSEGTFGIPPLGTRILRSAGVGEIRRGWIEVRTDTASVSGLLTYRNTETGLEVSVEPVELGNHFAQFVEESSGIGTGLAIFKPDPSSTIEFRIYGEDGINPLGEGPARVGNFNQVARTIPEWFDADGINTEFLQDFRGILLLRSEDGSLFAPIGIRFGKRGRIALIGSCDPGHSGSGVAPQS